MKLLKVAVLLMRFRKQKSEKRRGRNQGCRSPYEILGEIKAGWITPCRQGCRSPYEILRNPRRRKGGEGFQVAVLLMRFLF